MTKIKIIFDKNRCVCSNEWHHYKIFTAADSNFKQTKKKAIFYKCKKCCSLYPDIFPTLSTINLAYRNYYTFTSPKNKIKSLVSYFFNLSRKKYLYRNLPLFAKNVLDYGCGSGEFLLKIKRPDLELFGTDTIEPLNKTNFIWIPLEEFFNQIEVSYDWITMSHVLEHTHFPNAVITNLRNYLSPSGSIWISTPNANSILFDCFKGFARDADFPRHRIIFSQYALKNILENCGYHTEFLTPPRINFILNFISCSKNLLSSSETPFIIKFNLILKALFKASLHLILPASYRLKKSPELIVIAKKNNE